MLRTKTCAVQAPVFVPVGTYGTVQGGLTPEAAYDDIGFEIILGKCVSHLLLRPGPRDHRKIQWACTTSWGGINQFLTDSGGFQIWSLNDLRKITGGGR